MGNVRIVKGDQFARRDKLYKDLTQIFKHPTLAEEKEAEEDKKGREEEEEK